MKNIQNLSTRLTCPYLSPHLNSNCENSINSYHNQSTWPLYSITLKEKIEFIQFNGKTKYFSIESIKYLFMTMKISI